MTELNRNSILLNELIEKFSIERVHKAGAKFNYEKAKWFNQEWIRKISVEELSAAVRKIYDHYKLHIPDEIYLAFGDPAYP